MNIKCDTCSKIDAPIFHALFWTEDKGGKRELGYRCDKIERFSESRLSGYKELKRTTGTRPIAESEWPAGILEASIPVEWTRARKKEVEGKQQGQLILMYKKP
jgi:hypothetical protein